MFKNLKIFLSSNQIIALVILFILLSFSALLEILGVGIIPVFISAVLDHELLNIYLTKINITSLNFLIEIPQDKLLTYMTIFIIILYVFKNFFLLFVNYLQSFFSYKVTVYNSERLYKKYLFSDFSYHLEKNSSTLVKNIAHEIGGATTFIMNILSLVRELIIFVFISILLLINSPKGFVYIALVLLLFLILFYFLIKNKIKSSSKKVFESREQFIFSVQQSLSFIKELILLDKRNIFYEYFKKKLKIKESQHVFMEVVTKVPRLTFELLAVLICLLLVNYFFETSKNQLLPILSLYGIGLIRMIPSYTQISSSLVNLRFYKLPFDFICAEIEKENRVNSKKNNVDDFNLPKYTKDHVIKINQLSFGYNENENILENLNFTIKAGEAIGIVGSSGSGKTTLGDIMMGLYNPSKGSITYNDIDISQIPDQWRKIVGYVPQEIFLTDSNIKKNIAVEFDEKKIDMSRLKFAIKFANCEEFINKLPNNINTEVGERGVKLSGGQRQRIGIARALYNQPDIILFDEATSSLDIKNEKEIIESIAKLKGNKTLICISHKLSNLKNMDKIISIKDKKVNIIENPDEIINYLNNKLDV